MDPGNHEVAPADGSASAPLATQLRAAPVPGRLSERLAVAAAVVAAALALGSLFGWALDIGGPRSVLPDAPRCLSICRSIIEAHGGRLWAKPTQPRGAVFQFTLPRAPEVRASPALGQPGAGMSDTELGSGAVAGPSASPRPFQRK